MDLLGGVATTGSASVEFEKSNVGIVALADQFRRQENRVSQSVTQSDAVSSGSEF